MNSSAGSRASSRRRPSYKPNKADWLEGAWSGLQIASGEDRRGETAVDMETLKEIGKALTAVPEDFTANRKILRLLEQQAADVRDPAKASTGPWARRWRSGRC